MANVFDTTPRSARNYSRSDFEDFMRKRDMPEFQTERETRYRFMTPGVVDRYVTGMNPRKNIPMGESASTPERDAGAYRAAPPAGSMVTQLLEGPPVGGEEKHLPATTGGQPPAGPAHMPVSSWGGTMRPVTLPQGANLLELKPTMTGVENDPVLVERKAEFDRNLPDFLRRPFKSRAEFEQGITQLPGAGEEILAHIQQRATENMPPGMRQEWEETVGTRTAIQKETIAAGARDAAYQHFLKTAKPEQISQFHESHELTPAGWEKARQTPEEKKAAQRAAIERQAAEQYPTLGPDEEMYDLSGGQIGVLPKIVVLNKKQAGSMMLMNPQIKPYVPLGATRQAAPPPVEEDNRGWLARMLKPKTTGNQAPPAPGVSGTPGSAEAATPGGASMEGRTATHPQTGQKIIFRNGKWEPK